MRTSGQKIPEWRQRIFWSPFQWRNFESGSLYLVHIYAKDLKDLDAGCTYMLLDSCSPLDVDFTIKNNKNNGTLMRTRWLTMFVTRRLATTYFLEYPTFNMWHHCGCCLCRLFFFSNIICWRKIPTSRWGSDRNISKRYDLLGHLNWCFGVCPFVSTSMLVYGPIIVYCVNPHFCWSNSDSGLRLPYYSCVDRPFLFFSRWHLR